MKHQVRIITSLFSLMIVGVLVLGPVALSHGNWHMTMPGCPAMDEVGNFCTMNLTEVLQQWQSFFSALPVIMQFTWLVFGLLLVSYIAFFQTSDGAHAPPDIGKIISSSAQRYKLINRFLLALAAGRIHSKLYA